MSEETNNIEPKKSKKCTLLCVLTILSLLFSIASLATSIYTLANGGGMGDKKVVISKQYDKGKSLKKALDTEKPVIVFFYTDWCGFCQRFVPTYHKLSKDKDIKKNFAIAYVNCEDSANSKLVEEYGVQGYPSVYVVDKNSNRTHIDNHILFGDDAVKAVKEKALELIK